MLYDNKASAAVGHKPYLIEEVDTCYDVVHHVFMNREGTYTCSLLFYVSVNNNCMRCKVL